MHLGGSDTPGPSPPGPGAPPATAREHLILAAERLYSEIGPSVALRDIAAAAGQRNNAAVSYHFGDRSGLVDAILDVRSGAMETVRATMLEAADPDTLSLSGLMRMLVVPTLQTPYEQGSTHYARFLEAIRSQQRIVADPRWSTTKRVLTMIGDRLPHYSPEARRLRMRSAGSAMFAIAADLERDRERGQVLLGADEVIQMLVGLVLPGDAGPDREGGRRGSG